jgi:hypothetical protein
MGCSGSTAVHPTGDAIAAPPAPTTVNGNKIQNSDDEKRTHAAAHQMSSATPNEDTHASPVHIVKTAFMETKTVDNVDNSSSNGSQAITITPVLTLTPTTAATTMSITPTPTTAAGPSMGGRNDSGIVSSISGGGGSGSHTASPTPRTTIIPLSVLSQTSLHTSSADSSHRSTVSSSPAPTMSSRVPRNVDGLGPPPPMLGAFVNPPNHIAPTGVVATNASEETGVLSVHVHAAPPSPTPNVSSLPAAPSSSSIPSPTTPSNLTINSHVATVNMTHDVGQRSANPTTGSPRSETPTISTTTGAVTTPVTGTVTSLSNHASSASPRPIASLTTPTAIMMASSSSPKLGSIPLSPSMASSSPALGSRSGVLPNGPSSVRGSITVAAPLSLNSGRNNTTTILSSSLHHSLYGDATWLAALIESRTLLDDCVKPLAPPKAAEPRSIGRDQSWEDEVRTLRFDINRRFRVSLSRSKVWTWLADWPLWRINQIVNVPINTYVHGATHTRVITLNSNDHPAISYVNGGIPASDNIITTSSMNDNDDNEEWQTEETLLHMDHSNYSMSYAITPHWHILPCMCNSGMSTD